MRLGILIHRYVTVHLKVKEDVKSGYAAICYGKSNKN